MTDTFGCGSLDSILIYVLSFMEVLLNLCPKPLLQCKMVGIYLTPFACQEQEILTCFYGCLCSNSSVKNLIIVNLLSSPVFYPSSPFYRSLECSINFSQFYHKIYQPMTRQKEQYLHPQMNAGSQFHLAGDLPLISSRLVRLDFMSEVCTFISQLVPYGQFFFILKNGCLLVFDYLAYEIASLQGRLVVHS